MAAIAPDLVDPPNFFFGNRRRASGGLSALGPPLALLRELMVSGLQLGTRRRKPHPHLGARCGRAQAGPSLQPASGARGRRCGLADDAPPI
eukprot:1843278-Prymnesium_polylepis.1